MKKLFTLLTLGLLLATCLFANVNGTNANNTAPANTTAITDTGPALANTLVVNEVATIETATASNLAAGTEKNACENTTNATATIPANAPAPEVATLVIKPMQANNTPAAGAGHRNTELSNLKL